MRKTLGIMGRRSGHGVGIIEFAVILPILVFAGIGIVDFGRAFWYHNTLTEAVRQGSLYAAVHAHDVLKPSDPDSNADAPGDPGTNTKVAAVVRRLAYGLDPSQLTVASNLRDGDDLVGRDVVVEARYSYKPLIPWINDGKPISFSVKSSGRIRASTY